SVVDATRCVIEIQSAIAVRNMDAPEDKRMEFRVGVNLGDIIIEGDDILGEGVNVAARLQTLAPPGGVCLSQRVHEDVRDRLDVPFEDCGEQTLKNIARPVRMWRWTPAGVPAPAAVLRAAPSEKPSIAVLPFTNMSGDQEQEYFSEGICED